MTQSKSTKSDAINACSTTVILRHRCFIDFPESSFLSELIYFSKIELFSDSMTYSSIFLSNPINNKHPTFGTTIAEYHSEFPNKY